MHWSGHRILSFYGVFKGVSRKNIAGTRVILLHRERGQVLGACCPHSGREILLRCRKLLFSHCSGVALLLRNHH